MVSVCSVELYGDPRPFPPFPALVTYFTVVFCSYMLWSSKCMPCNIIVVFFPNSAFQFVSRGFLLSHQLYSEALNQQVIRELGKS